MSGTAEALVKELRAMARGDSMALTDKRQVCEDAANFIEQMLPRYRCGTCGTSDRAQYIMCHHPMCPDGRDQ